MKVFEFEDYKTWLISVLKQKNRVKSGQQSALAEALGCKPSYISKVLSDKNHLSLEQAAGVADFFALSPAEKSYLIAAIGENRATTETLKIFWKQKKQDAYNQHMDIRSRLHLEQHLGEHQMLIYYSSWHYSAIHVAVSIPELQTIDSLSAYFQIPKAQVRDCLKFLCDVGLAKREDNLYKVNRTSLHLDKNSPLLQNHHLNWKHKTIEAMQAKKKMDLNFLSIMSLSKKDYNTIRDILLNTIQKTNETVEPSKDEIVACFAIDFFELDRFDVEDEKNDQMPI
jgi:uncharacterized protein (TIGR02147 family)